MLIRSMNFSLVLVMLVAVALSGCESHGEGGGTTDEQLTVASEYLQAGDISSARVKYTQIIGSDPLAMTVSKGADPNNSEARFGRALCDMILLMERDPFTAILAGFGQPAWATTSVFGESGYLAQSLTNPDPDLSSLPFHNIAACRDTSNEPILGRCLLSRVTEGYTFETMASSFDSLMVYIDAIITDLEVAINDSSASYTIPKELYSGDADIPINHADMVQILAEMYMLSAQSDFMNSWRFNVDLSSLVDENGEALVTPEEMVDLLNAQFALRSDNKLASARQNLINSTYYSIQAMEEVLAGSTGGVLNLSEENEPLYQDFYDGMNAAYNSFGGAQALAGILPMVEVNLESFFQNPADGGSISSDPFVLEGGKIKTVEAYWQQMISTVCDYTFDMDGVRALSDASRAVSSPYYQLFNVVMGHTYGKHRL